MSKAGPIDGSGRPLIRKRGTVECDLVEATPVVFHGRVYRGEWVRTAWKGNALKRNYGHLVDHATGKPATGPVGVDDVFHSAFVEGDTAYVLGTSSELGWTGRRVTIHASRDLQRWEQWTALDLEGFGICNTSLTKAGDRYCLMFEIHLPKEQAGEAFTARFAFSNDLRHWELTPPECNYAKDRYTAPHCLRWMNGWFYDFYLEAFEGYETRVVRSRDLVHWVPSPRNPVLKASPEDRHILNPTLTSAERERIAKADDINNSDIDVCEHEGRLIVSYSWGNQQGNEFLAEGVYDGSLEQFLKGWF